MENNVEAKMQSMQKFVPFLHKLQEMLLSEKGNEDKLVQIQLLNNLLINPQKTVSIEELTNCEAALLHLYDDVHPAEVLKSKPDLPNALVDVVVRKCLSLDSDVLTGGEETADKYCSELGQKNKVFQKDKENHDHDKKEIFVKESHGVKETDIYQMDEKKTDTISITDSDEGDVEENVEIVIPGVESDEMILPDLAAEILVKNEINELIEKREKSRILHEDPTSDTEMIAFESGSDSRHCGKAGGDDPLNVEESTNGLMFTEATSDYKDDDVDEVQVIETRNSPICIDSDENSDHSPSNSTANPNNKIQTNNLANKSAKEEIPKITSVVRSRIIKKSKITYNTKKKYKLRLEQSYVIDTIDLVDSSDEESVNSKKPSIKRRLLVKHIKPAKSSSSQSPKESPLRCTPPKRLISSNISTPQSNFLNAVNLQPTNIANPPAFLAHLLNRNVIIPNAFYGNPPEIRNQTVKATKATQVFNTQAHEIKATAGREGILSKEQIYRRWLDNFLVNFASPLQVASHTCFVLLQRVLKYRSLQKIKDARTNLNDLALRHQTNTTPSSVDIQLILDLRNVFYKSDSQLSEDGVRFCEFASKYVFDKVVPLTTDIKTGRVTSRTPNDEGMLQNTSVPNKQLNGSIKTPSNQSNSWSKRKQKPDLDEYTPSKPVLIAADRGDAGLGERKRSLRKKRTKCYDANFSYNEDHHEERDEEDSDAAIQRKIEQKRQEAKQKREHMAKSFENAFIEAFTKNNSNANYSKRSTLHTAKDPGKDCSALLTTPVLLENGLSCGKGTVAPDYFGDNDCSLDDGPKEHRIYKVAPSTPCNVPKSDGHNSAMMTSSISSEVISCSDGSEDIEEIECKNFDPASAPKNTDLSMHANAKKHDLCVICRRYVKRIVHHYVNEHRGCEIYTSRLTNTQVTKLRRNSGNLAEEHLYKNGQIQYEATCVFCQKRSRFMLSDWYQHFTMHTGEYAYYCDGCGIQKPTRPLLHAHTKTLCRRGGSVRQNFIFDVKTTKIEASVCRICNYVQLQRSHVVHHLHTQHGVNEILPKHIECVALLKFPPKNVDTSKTAINADELKQDSGSSHNNIDTNVHDSHEDHSKTQFVYDDSDEADDLSFMICGMLDVQVHTE